MKDDCAIAIAFDCGLHLIRAIKSSRCHMLKGALARVFFVERVIVLMA